MAKKRKSKRKKHAKARKAPKQEKEVKVTVGYEVLGLILLVVLIAAAAVYYNSMTPAAPPAGGAETPPADGTTPAAGEDKVKLEFYVMSQCPYGTQVEDAIKPVLDKIGGSVDFHLDYIANDNGDGTFGSLHGQPEVDENIRQLCAIKYGSEGYKYMDYIFCRNKNIQSTAWESCAREAALDVAKVTACAEGAEGKALHSESVKRAEARGARGSPTIYLADQQYSGGRDALSFQRALCAHLEGNPACEGMPACASDADCTAKPGKIGKCANPNQEDARCDYVDPLPVKLIVLNDKTCSSCDTSNIVGVSKQLFLGLTTRNVDVASAEGEKLVEALGITVVPAYLFDGNVVNTASWKTNSRLAASFEKKGDYYKILDSATGARRHVSEDARKAYQEAIGLTSGDNRPQIDFFVMSYCPYGNIAEEAIEPVYQLLGDKAEFKPHYVIYSNYQGGGPNYCLDDESKYCSMHGIQELNQNIRELCVDKYMGIGKYFEFVLAMNKECNSRNADACWTAVAEGLGLDTAKIAECESEEGLAFAKADLELGNTLGVSGSPTIFVEGEDYAGGRSPEGYKTALCAKYDTAPSECSTQLEGAATAAAPSGGCG